MAGNEHPLIEARAERTRWFLQDRFGMFIHWGLYALLARGEWVRSVERISNEDYQKYFEEFNPDHYDPKTWAKLARQAGMRYAVLTAKHHDGFCLFDSQLTGYKSTNTPCSRDLVREYVEAFRAEGLKVGLYYSLLDWHHPDYPAYGDRHHPMRESEDYKNRPQDFSRYIETLHGQVRELLSDYGKIDIIWFDGGWERMPDEWQATELEAMIRSLQPEILINDRLPGAGDYNTPEQFVPPQVPDRAWEACMTINESWGYNPDDKQFKSGRQLVHTLCEIAARGGNLLLNVGPMADGKLPPELLERLAVIEGWMARHAESIIGTAPGLEPWQFYGPSTRRGDRIYLHLLMRPYDTVSVRGLPIRRVRSVRALGAGRELAFTTRAPIIESMFGADPVGEVTITVPENVVDPYATVLALDVA